MSAARRAELYATLARETAAQARALAKQARAFAELAHLEGHPGVETGELPVTDRPANDPRPAADLVTAETLRERPRRLRGVGAMLMTGGPPPPPDDIARARAKAALRKARAIPAKR